ncbi:tetratricopeptide repeat protein [Thalassotalea aquiviva]|uniref:tetratricopeptide repeat protein n=1 Tax=Thalassotalea aquiviva TaxID=3242415 RepID=UPI003529EF34
MKDLLFAELKSQNLNIVHSISLIEQELFSVKADKIRDLKQLVDALVIDSQQQIESIDDALDRAEKLLELLFVDNLLVDSEQTVWPLTSQLLETSIAFRSIAPPLKSLLLLYIIRSCGFSCDAVFVPDEVMIRIVCDDDYAIIFNPIDGKPINWFELEQRIENPESLEQSISIETVSDQDLIAQHLMSLKTALIREQQFELALKCTDIILGLRPEDPYQRKERGALLQQLDCYKVAFDDYRYFVEKCPKDPSAKILQIQLEMIQHLDPVLH